MKLSIVIPCYNEKYALDKHPEDAAHNLKGIDYIRQDMEGDPRLPFPADYFDAISMLAVIEHLQPPMVPLLLMDIHRVLKKGGECLLLKARRQMNNEITPRGDKHKDGHE